MVQGGLSDFAVGPLRHLLYFYFWSSQALVRGIGVLFCSLVACIPPFPLSTLCLIRPLFTVGFHADI